MPRDARLFMTFPIDFDEHPKVEPLSDAAFRAFVSMNGYSRRQDLDGRIPKAVARKRWGDKVMSELVASHPERPLVYLDITIDSYVIRDYAEHQETTTSIEARRQRNAENGRKGGRPRKNQAVTESDTHSVTESDSDPGTQSASDQKAESRVQRTTTKTSSSQSRSNRASVSTDSISPMTLKLAGQAGITSLPAIADTVRKHAGREITPDAAYRVCVWILGKSRAEPRAPQRYVTGAISRSPFEVQQFIDEQGLAS